MRDLQAAGGTPLTSGDASTPEPDSGGASRPRRAAALTLVAAGVYAIDLASKTIVVAMLENRPPVRLIGDLLQLRVIRNPGAAFSIGTGMTFVFTLIAVVVAAVIVRYAPRLRSLPWAITLGLLLGGALGNLTDRLFRAPAPFEGHVVDFIAVGSFPVFNAADSAIVCGGVLAVALAWLGYRIDGGRERTTATAAPGSGRMLPEAYGSAGRGREQGDDLSDGEGRKVTTGREETAGETAGRRER
ncbi:signal peptidase II [Thermopolyspora sp. NPDC052614]|uniref:signal peptidase II n=1 Tax=Thermopolyspora sp. NPDC052614 TaxID=3155682 RepID=UPI0034483918